MYEVNRPIIKEISAVGVEELCAAVLIRAVKDYQDLNQQGLLSRKGKRSKNEIAQFFNSEWCELMLRAIGSNLYGEEILSCLQSQKLTK